MLWSGGGKTKPTPLDPTIKSGLHFGSRQTLEEEQQEAVRKFNKRFGVSAVSGTETAETASTHPKMLKTLGLVHVDSIAHRAIESPKHKDPFTSFIQEILALTIYGDAAKEPADAAHDTPELAQDKAFFRVASEKAAHFETRLLQPRTKRVAEWMDEQLRARGNQDLVAFHDALRRCPCLQSRAVSEDDSESGFVSIWSGQPAEIVMALTDSDIESGCAIFVTDAESRLLRVLHNLYHFKAYVQAIVTSTISQAQVDAASGLLEVWYFAAGHRFALKPVRAWPDVGETPFADAVRRLHKVWNATAFLVVDDNNE